MQDARTYLEIDKVTSLAIPFGEAARCFAASAPTPAEWSFCV